MSTCKSPNCSLDDIEIIPCVANVLVGAPSFCSNVENHDPTAAVGDLENHVVVPV